MRMPSMNALLESVGIEARLRILLLETELSRGKLTELWLDTRPDQNGF